MLVFIYSELLSYFFIRIFIICFISAGEIFLSAMVIIKIVHAEANIAVMSLDSWWPNELNKKPTVEPVSIATPLLAMYIRKACSDQIINGMHEAV